MESPTSKNKYKSLSKFMEDLEKNTEKGFGDIVTDVMAKVR